MKIKTKFRLLVMVVAVFFILQWISYNVMAVKVILGEAADQSFIGKIAVGEVIRRRGKFEAFSSTKRDLHQFYQEQPRSARLSAQLAWMISLFTNFSRNADHFDNVKAFGEPEWAAGMKKTVKIDDMQYYRSQN